MQSDRRSPAPESRRVGYLPIGTKRTQLQRLSRGWGCGTSDARMKLPSLAPDSAARFLRTFSFRLTTNSAKSHSIDNSKKKGGDIPAETEQTTMSREEGSGAPTGNDRTTSSGDAGTDSPTENDRLTSSGVAEKWSRTGNDRTTFSGEARTDSPTGNDRSSSSGDADKWPRTGNGRIPPSSGNQRGLSPRSLSVAAFFRRVHSGHQTPKGDRAKREKDVATLGRSVQSDRSTSDESDSCRKRNFILHGFDSIRIRDRNCVINYKSLDGTNQPQDVDTGRYSFRSKLRRDVQRHTIQVTEPCEDRTAKLSGTSRGNQRSVSDGEEEEKEQSSKDQQSTSLRFQRSSALWRSFSAKSRARSSDILSDATRSVADDQSRSYEREDIRQELKLLDDVQKQRQRLGFLALGEPDVFPEQHASRNIRSRVSDAYRQSSSTSVKGKELGRNDLERYRQHLDRLYAFNVAHAHYTEAAFVLCEHAQSCCSVEGGFQKEERVSEEEWGRWEGLLLRAVDDFELGRTWEYAIDVCERLTKIYKARFMYAELSQILRKQASLYRQILQEPRPKPYYFMVHFVGGDFPDAFTDRRFVLRTETMEDEYELDRFIGYQFNGVKRLCDRLDQRETATKGNTQRGYRLFSLKPVPSLSVSIPGLRKVPDAVQFFHRYNNVSSFEVVANGDGEAKSVVNIELSLPAVSRWAQVTSKTADV